MIELSTTHHKLQEDTRYTTLFIETIESTTILRTDKQLTYTGSEKYSNGYRNLPWIYYAYYVNHFELAMQ